MNICIIGGGVGGLTAALACAQRGAQVTVYEQASEINEVGAGIQVSPNGLCVLRALGLEPELQSSAVQAQAVELRDYQRGALVTRLDLTQLEAGQRYFFLHRADLIATLANACRETGVDIKLSQSVKTVRPGAAPKLVLEDDTEISADLIIAADGLKSVARTVLNGASAPFFTGQVAWRATVANEIGHADVAQVHMGPKRHLVSYPLRGGKLINLVAVQERGDWVAEGWSQSDSPENLQSAFADFGGTVPKMLEAVQDVGLWGLFRHPVAPNWYGENIALLGDAAHPMLPFMAQGAVMAIEDAWTLMDCLSSCDTTQTALALYQAKRKDRVSKVVETANGNARKYHLSYPPVRKAAHLAIKTAGAIAPGKMLGQFDWIYRHDVTRSAN